jgi:hypothetical protein
MSLIRLRSWLSGLWAGAVLCIGGLAAPALFAVLERAQAGLAAGRLFRLDASLSLVLSVLLLIVERRVAGARTEQGQGGSRMSAELVLILAALFCTVAGYFAIQPLMEQARAGLGNWSFGVLHGISSAFFAAKAVVLTVLAWRCTAR